MSAVVHARVTEQLRRLRLRSVADSLDAVLSEAARTEPTYLDFLDALLRQEVDAKQRTRVAMGLKIAHFPTVAGKHCGPVTPQHFPPVAPASTLVP
jgi:DNA replication protein DnaC